jgi:hypothetical protein
MGISRYPRFGQRIAPATLREILDVAIPSALVGSAGVPYSRLADLDHTVWERLQPKVCELLAKAVVGLVKHHQLPAEVNARFLPRITTTLPLESLNLGRRTYNCLKACNLQTIGALGNLTVNMVCHIRNFGAKSLVDLLVALESFDVSRATTQFQLAVSLVESAKASPPSPKELPSQIQIEVSHYPRVGCRLAPRILGCVLDVLVNDRRISGLKLADLDESAWERFTPETCRRLAAAIVRKVALSQSSVRSLLGNTLIPVPRTSGKPIVLQMERRTFNCLKHAGLLEDPRNLANVTIRRLVAMQSFGAKSLVDLLSSLESHTPTAHDISPEVVVVARRLARIKQSEAIRIDDPRFGMAIQSLGFHGESLKDIAEQIVNSPTCPIAPKFFAKRLNDLYSRLRSCGQLKLEDELRELISFEHNVRDREISVSHFGWDGLGRKTLEEVAKRYRMTRERARQICQRHIDYLADKQPFLPVLDRVLDTIAKKIPGSVQGLELLLAENGLSKYPFQLDGIMYAAEIARRGIPFVIEKVDELRYALPPNEKELLQRILQIACKSVSHWGATTLEDVAAQASEQNGNPITCDLVARILRPLSAFAWLDEASGWFWLESTARNALLNQIEKVLCVCDKIHVTELRAGVSRPHRREGIAPPQRVLLELCRQLHWCSVSDDMIAAQPRLDPEKFLNDSEKTLLRVLKENGPVIQREKFEDLCLLAGMNRHSFYVFLTYSPIVTKYAPGVYGLRGADVPPGVVTSVAPKRRRANKVILDYGWTKDGKIRILYRLSKAAFFNGILSIPAALKQFLQQTFAITTTDGFGVGSMSVKDCSAWGLGPFFRRRGGEPGDYLLVLFDLSKHEAEIQIGDAALIDSLDFSDREAMGFHWEPTRGSRGCDSWESGFQQLAAFKEKHGHCNVPWTTERSLGNWVYRQRRARKIGKLDADRTRRLQELGFPWIAKRKSGEGGLGQRGSWDARFHELVEFKNKHGHCNVVRAKNRVLGQWVSFLRYKNKIGKLDADRIRRLEGIGFQWAGRGMLGQAGSGQRASWWSGFQQLVAFKNKHGHCNVPRATDRRLGQWVSNQRHAKKVGKLDVDHIRQLEEIGFQWTGTGKLGQGGSGQRTSWESAFQQLVVFKEQHGHCNVSLTKDQFLAGWVYRQRHAKKSGKLDADRIRRLEEIGFQ